MEAESYGGNLELAANRIDTLLQAQHGSVTGATSGHVFENNLLVD